MKRGEGSDANWTTAELSVLRSAERDEPTPGSLDRTLTALGVGSQLGAGLVGASAAKKAGLLASLGRGWLSVTLLGAVLVGGGLVSVAVARHGRAGAAAPASPNGAASPQQHAVPAAASVPSVAAVPAQDPPAPLIAPPAPPPVPALAHDTGGSVKDSLAEEIRLIDEARTRLHQGDPAGALGAIARYDQLVKRGGSMRAEATVVRIEALQASGDTARAAKLGSRFMAQNPGSPYVGYVKRVLSRPQ